MNNDVKHLSVLKEEQVITVSGIPQVIKTIWYLDGKPDAIELYTGTLIHYDSVYKE